MNNVLLNLTHIVQAISLLESPQEQVLAIVNSISQTLDQDVCSLYRIDQDGHASLIASHGLIVEDFSPLPPGEGLVGLVAKTRRSLNIADAASHPNFYILPNSNERKFKSFCGVPLVRSGQVIGVLVVQSKSSVALNEEGEAFLVTLASQLAMLVSDIPLIYESQSTSNKTLTGFVGAPGIAIGFSRISVESTLQNVPDAKCVNSKSEILRLKQLLAATRTSIEEEQKLFGEELPENVSRIFETYSQLLCDTVFIKKIESEILTGNWLPGALRISVNYYSDIFKAMEDPYLSARHEDLEHLGEKLLEVWNDKNVDQRTQFDSHKSIILIGRQISISEIARVPRSNLGGIVSFAGSSLSHSSVLARALGIPAIVGVREIKGLKSGTKMILDGHSGQIITHPTKEVLEEYRQLIKKDKTHQKLLEVLQDKEAVTNDGVKISLMVNTGLLADISPGIKSGAEGVGLYRTEIPFMVHNSFPLEEEQVTFYSEVFKAYGEKPVYMRTLDIGGDKQLPYFPIHHEENPALGWRGIRLTLDVVQLMVTQLRAMLRAAGSKGNLHIILPMVSSIDEVLKFKEVLVDVCNQLDSEHHLYRKPRVGIMIEVPAAISQIGMFSKHIDFLSIGTNDLSQYLLAVDRNNAKVANRHDFLHPAILFEISRIIKAAKQCDLPVTLCGEMSTDPTAVVLLMGMGIRQLSMSAAMLPEIKHMIRMLSFDRIDKLTQKALATSDPEMIRDIVEAELLRVGYRESSVTA